MKQTKAAKLLSAWPHQQSTTTVYEVVYEVQTRMAPHCRNRNIVSKPSRTCVPTLPCDMRPALASSSPAPTLTHQDTKQAKLATTQTLRAARPLCLPPMAPTQPMPPSSQAVAAHTSPSIPTFTPRVHSLPAHYSVRLYATTVQLRICTDTPYRVYNWSVQLRSRKIAGQTVQLRSPSPSLPPMVHRSMGHQVLPLVP